MYIMLSFLTCQWSSVFSSHLFFVCFFFFWKRCFFFFLLVMKAVGQFRVPPPTTKRNRVIE